MLSARYLLIGFLLAASPFPAFAGDPVPYDACPCELWTPEEAARRAVFAFAGDVLSVDESKATFVSRFYMKGLRVLKPVIALNQPNGLPGCKVTFEPEKTYAVLAMGNFDDGYYTDACLQRQLNENDDQKRKVAQLMGPIYHEAQDMLRVLQQDPMQLGQSENLAKTYMRGNDPEAALGQYVYLTEATADPLPYILGQGEAMIMLGPLKAKEALSRFDDVIEKQPDNQQAWSGRYRALALLGRWNELPATANISRITLTHASLNADLQSLNLTESTIEDTSAKDRQLNGADLTAVNMRRSDFRNAGLANAKMARMRSSQSDFSGANLTGADMTFSRLINVSLRGANLEGVDLTGAQLDGVDFTGANLKGTRLTGITAVNVTWPAGFNAP